MPRRLRRSLKVILPLVVLGLAVVVFVWLADTRPQMAARPPQERDWPVAVTPAQRVDVQPMIEGYGTVVAGRTADLRPLVAGEIAEVGEDLVEGGRVGAGELLLAIAPEDYRDAVAEKAAELAEAEARRTELESQQAGEQAQLDFDRHQVDLNRSDFERFERLARSGTGSVKQQEAARLALVRSEQAVAQRQSSIRRLEAQIAQARAAIDKRQRALDKAKRDLAETRLVAPFDGVLSGVNAAEGRLVSTGDRIAQLIDPRRLEVRFHVTESEFARLVSAGGVDGRPVTVFWRTGPREAVFQGRLARAESRIDSATGGVDLFATLDGLGPDTLLRPGASVTVQVPDRVYDQVVVLPAAAVHRDGDGFRVYVVGEGDRLGVVPVTRVLAQGDRVLVRGDLHGDMPVVVTRFPEMAPGVKVRPVQERPAAFPAIAEGG